MSGGGGEGPGCLHIEMEGKHVRLDAEGLVKASREIRDLGRKIVEATRLAHGLGCDE
jgi:hypothetical protein